jgi:hypothetical protein
MLNAIRDAELTAVLHRSEMEQEARQFRLTQISHQAQQSARHLPVDRDLEDMIVLSEMMRNALRRMSFSVS